MKWRRARWPAQKAERQASILAAAATMFGEQGFEAVSLNGIARRAGVAKSNIYRYFESKEEIFLNLLLQDLRECVAAIEPALVPLADSGDCDAVARVLASSIAERPRLGELMAVLSGVLERNISAATVLRFKTAIAEVLIRIANALRGAMPELTMEEAGQFLLFFPALIAGLWPMAHPAPVVEGVLSRPEFAHLSVDFSRDLTTATAAILRGMLAKTE